MSDARQGNTFLHVTTTLEIDRSPDCRQIDVNRIQSAILEGLDNRFTDTTNPLEMADGKYEILRYSVSELSLDDRYPVFKAEPPKKDKFDEAAEAVQEAANEIREPNNERPLPRQYPIQVQCAGEIAALIEDVLDSHNFMPTQTLVQLRDHLLEFTKNNGIPTNKYREFVSKKE